MWAGTNTITNHIHEWNFILIFETSNYFVKIWWKPDCIESIRLNFNETRARSRKINHNFSNLEWFGNRTLCGIHHKIWRHRHSFLELKLLPSQKNSTKQHLGAFSRSIQTPTCEQLISSYLDQKLDGPDRDCRRLKKKIVLSMPVCYALINYISF